MLGQFTWENQADRGLNFSASNCGSLVHAAELRCFVGDLVEGISHEVVHDRNALLGNAGIWMNLLQYFINVNVVRFMRFSFALSFFCINDHARTEHIKVHGR